MQLDIEKLTRIERKYRLAAFALPLMLVILSIIFLSIASGTVNQIIIKRKELLIKQQTVNEAAVFNTYIVANKDKLTQIHSVIPNESAMIGVIQDFEAVVASYDPTSVVQITSAAPSRIGTYLAVSLIIKCQTSLNDLPILIDRVNQLPYIHQLLSVDTNQAGEVYSHQLSLRLYVQEPFNSP